MSFSIGLRVPPKREPTRLTKQQRAYVKKLARHLRAFLGSDVKSTKIKLYFGVDVYLDGKLHFSGKKTTGEFTKKDAFDDAPILIGEIMASEQAAEDKWDKQIAADAKAGRLDKFIAETEVRKSKRQRAIGKRRAYGHV